MNLLISITKCFPGMYDQYSLKQYAELGAFGPEATVLKRAFKSPARIGPNFDCHIFSQKDVRMLCER
jgi:hypothetical protein